MAVIEDHTREGVVDAVVDVVAELPIADGLADDLADSNGGRGDHEAARLGDDLHVLREEAIEFAIEDLGELMERLDRVVVRRREAAADVEQVHLVVATFLRFFEDAGREADRLHVVLDVGRLRADVERQAFANEPAFVGREDQVDGFARGSPELARQFDHRAGVRHLEAQHDAGVGRVLLDLVELGDVVECDQRLVLIEFLQRFDRLDRVRVDDLVPDPRQSLLLRQVRDVLVDVQELRHRRDVERGTLLIERANDRGVGVGLDRVVDLHARQVLAEGRVVAAQLIVVDDEERRAVFGCELLEAGLGQHRWSVSRLR